MFSRVACQPYSRTANSATVVLGGWWSVCSVICLLHTVCAAVVCPPRAATESDQNHWLPRWCTSTNQNSEEARFPRGGCWCYSFLGWISAHPWNVLVDLDLSLSVENSTCFGSLKWGIITTCPLQWSCCLMIMPSILVVWDRAKNAGVSAPVVTFYLRDLFQTVLAVYFLRGLICLQ